MNFHTKSRQRYQNGSISKDKKRKRWVLRWREDLRLPAGVPLRNGDVILLTGEVIKGLDKGSRVPAPGEILRRKQNWEVLYFDQFPTEKDAQRVLDSHLAEINGPSYRPRMVTTFAEFAKKWEQDIMCHHKPSAQSSEKSVIKVHLTPAFGNFQLTDITAAVLQAWVSAHKAQPKTVKNIVTTLRTMWIHVRKWGYAQHDPFEELRLPTILKVQKTYFFSPEEMLAIVNEATGWKQLFFGIMAETGIRPGEMAGLRREDVRGEVLFIRQSVWQQEIQSVKTDNAIRQFVISSRCAHALEKHLEEAPHNPHNLVFASENGSPLSMDNFRNRTLNPILKKLGILEKIKAAGVRGGVYAFRHGNMTALSRAGTPLKTIQKRVGHSIGSDVTAEHYIHAVDADDRAAAEYMGALIWPKEEGETIQ